MRDEKGFDFKVLCVAIGDAHQQHIERLEQVRPHRLVEIEHFFETYKALEDKTVEVLGWRERDRALDVLRTDRLAWERESGVRSEGRRARGRPSAGSSSPPRSRTRPSRPSQRSSNAFGHRAFPTAGATCAGSGSMDSM
jgi:hypothetical protein